MSRRILGVCISLAIDVAIMSPLTPKVKYPHYGRQTNLESEAVTMVHLMKTVDGGNSSLEEAREKIMYPAGRPSESEEP